MSFGLTIEKLFLIGLIAILVVGPDRLPGYAAQFARLITRLRDLARGAETRLKDELGDDISIAELKKLDPRQYDPRRIIRDALNDNPTTTTPLRPASVRPKSPNPETPFDGEST
ncbi:MAG: Sec-independent protein translocase TatB [Microbacteriaceae bacterium]|nr:Sec-independent protein translocase TatB [Microbacteriaceae bacterium]